MRSLNFEEKRVWNLRVGGSGLVSSMPGSKEVGDQTSGRLREEDRLWLLDVWLEAMLGVGKPIWTSLVKSGLDFQSVIGAYFM